jgi:hypothetical protein
VDQKQDQSATRVRRCTIDSEPNPLDARYEENTKEIRSILRPSSFFGSVSHLVKGIRKYRDVTYFERVEGSPFLCVSYFYLPTYLQRYVERTYVLNSDEGLTDRTLVPDPRPMYFRQSTVSCTVPTSQDAETPIHPPHLLYKLGAWFGANP